MAVRVILRQILSFVTKWLNVEIEKFGYTLYICKTTKEQIKKQNPNLVRNW